MMAMVMMRTIVMMRTMVSMMMMIAGRRSNEAAMKYTARNRTHRSSGLSERLVLLSSSSSPSSLLSLLLLSLLLRKWCPAVVVVVAVMAMTVSFVRGDSVHQRDIDRLCGRNPPAPHIVGGRAASLLLRKNPRTFPFPCVVTQTIETESGRTRAGRTRLYIKLNQLAIQRAADGSCYHSLSIYGVRKAHTNATDAAAAAADVQVTLCGSLANLQQSEFESLDFDIDVVWNTTNNSDPALSAISLRESNFKMVVTAFRQVDPVSNECPSVTDPRRPDASVEWHRCANHRCIDARLRCNKFNNCGDSVASDELNCPPTKFSLPAVWPLIAVPVVSVLLLTGIIGVMYYRLDRTGC